MSVNPYASPAAETENVCDPEREIRVVICAFRCVGWFGLAIAASGVVAFLDLFVESLIGSAKINESAFGLLLVVAFYLSFGAVFAGYLWVASRMAHFSVHAQGTALLLSRLMLLGFPLFTLVGIVCIRKIKRDYAAYCDRACAKQ